MAVDVCVSEKQQSRRKSRNGMLSLSCLVEELQFKLSKVVDAMNGVTNYVNY